MGRRQGIPGIAVCHVANINQLLMEIAIPLSVIWDQIIQISGERIGGIVGTGFLWSRTTEKSTKSSLTLYNINITSLLARRHFFAAVVEIEKCHTRCKPTGTSLIDSRTG